MSTVVDAATLAEVRKLRKKLRQIENLQQSSRSLNDEEKLKISSKIQIREELQRILISLPKPSGRAVQDAIPTADLISNDVDDVDDDASEEKVQGQDYEDEGNGDKSDAESAIQESIETAASPNNDSCKRQLEDVRAAHKLPSAGKTVKRLKCDEKVKRSIREHEDASGGSDDSYRKTLSKLWRSSEFTVRQLVGHNDVVTAVAADANIVVSASLDTTVKVWNADTGQETHSLRGHTSSVTCLVLPSKGDSDELCRYLGLADRHRLALTGAMDCSVILWSLTSGEMVKSIYTFNTITCLVYVASEICIVTATDGGKIEIWDAIAGCSLRGLTMFDESYTCMKASGNHIYAASADGIIKVWEIRDRDLISRFTSEELGSDGDGDYDDGNQRDFVVRQVRCLDVCRDWLFYGDDGVNLKAFNWRTREMKKFINHLCESGVTDGVFCTDREVVSTSYDMDSGRSHLNVRLFPEGDYLCSLMDNEDATRINCVSCTATTKINFRIVTGGEQLKIWEISQLPRKSKGVTSRAAVSKPTFFERYTREATNSEYESSGCETDTSAEDDDGEGDGRYGRTYIPKDVSQRSSFGWSFCTIL